MQYATAVVSKCRIRLEIMPDSNHYKAQLDKFKEAARQLETSDDEARFDERVKKLVRQKPVEKSE